MREFPWHVRKPVAEHDQWFRNLTGLHALTRAWIHELHLEAEAPHLLQRVMSPRIQEALTILETLDERSVPKDLESVLGSDYPEELLGRLEQTIWVTQTWLLRHLFETTPQDEWDALKNSLAQSSWKAGRNCAEQRWGKLPEVARRDLRGVFSAINDGPLSGFPHHRAFLVVRALPERIEAELLHCPHRSVYPEIVLAADELCLLHADWIRGYAYGINTEVLIDHQKDVRCRQVWTLHQ
ncbi:MAG: hypothetical protein AB7P04_15710 [Bacteriovoracia bacterium]